MQVWELMAFLSKCPAGQEVWGGQGGGMLTPLTSVGQDGEGDGEFVELRLEEVDEE